MNNGVTFKRNGEITLFGHLVGVWTCHDVWAEHGGRYDAGGYSLVHYLWESNTIDGRRLRYYTNKHMRLWVSCHSMYLLKLAKSMTDGEKWEAINNAR